MKNYKLAKCCGNCKHLKYSNIFEEDTCYICGKREVVCKLSICDDFHKNPDKDFVQEQSSLQEEEK